MAQPNFGAAGMDSTSLGRNLDVMEMPEGVDIRFFGRKISPAGSAQKTECEAWGIYIPSNDGIDVPDPALVLNIGLWPDSVNLSLTEDTIQHERDSGDDPVEAVNTDEAINNELLINAVATDCLFIPRVRCSLQVSGRLQTSAPITNPYVYDWPLTDLLPAIDTAGNIFTATGLGYQFLPTPAGGLKSKAVLVSADLGDTNAGWTTISYSYNWIVSNNPSAYTVNMLDNTAMIADPTQPYAHYKKVALTYALSATGFATKSASVEYFPSFADHV